MSSTAPIAPAADVAAAALGPLWPAHCEWEGGQGAKCTERLLGLLMLISFNGVHISHSNLSVRIRGMRGMIMDEEEEEGRRRGRGRGRGGGRKLAKCRSLPANAQQTLTVFRTFTSRFRY
jgi:hypothetical protein